MKKIIDSIILAFIVIILTACNSTEDKSVLTNNAYLNHLPSIAKKYSCMCDAKERELNQCIDINEAYRLDKELNLLKREWITKIDEYNSSNPITKPLPFTELPNAAYTVNQITIAPDKVYKSHITIRFDVTITKDIKNDYGGFQKNLFIYYQATDNKGRAIPQTTSLATNFNENELIAGFTFSISGQLGPLTELENFATLQLVSQKEYNKTKHIKI